MLVQGIPTSRKNKSRKGKKGLWHFCGNVACVTLKVAVGDSLTDEISTKVYKLTHVARLPVTFIK